MTGRKTDLYEVICYHSEHGNAAYGMTFHDERTAAAYVRTMRRHGYTVEPSPVFSTEPNLTAALDSARAYFSDPRLKTEDA